MKKMLQVVLSFFMIATLFSIQTVSTDAQHQYNNEIIVVNDNDIGTGKNQILYEGQWDYDEHSDKDIYVGNDYHIFNDSGEEQETYPSLSMQFEGTGIEVFGDLGSDLGSINIYIDDTLVATKDLFDVEVKTQQLLYSVTDLVQGEHSIRVVVNKITNEHATGRSVVIDSFRVFNDVKVQDVNEVDNYSLDETELIINDSTTGTGLHEFNFSGAWGTSSGHDKFYGGDEHWYNFARYVEGQPLPSYSIQFTGTGIEIFGNKSTMMGIYTIYLDGEVVGTVDAYNSYERTQQSLFEIRDLELGNYEIKVELSNTKNEASSSFDGEVDYAKVYGIETEEPTEKGPLAITPTPQEIKYFGTDGADISKDVNIVVFSAMEEVVNQDAIKRLEAILTLNGHTYSISDKPTDNKTNIVLIDAAVESDATISTYLKNEGVDYTLADKPEGSLMKINETKGNTNVTIMATDTSGLFFGVVNFGEVLGQLNEEGKAYEVEINDYPVLAERGFIEGFFGPPWTHDGRKELLNFSGDVKMNRYIYGPKDDAYHRTKWRIPYPEELGKQISELVAISEENNVEFTWAVHTTLGGDTINFESQKDRDDLIAKFEDMYRLGVRSYSIFFDDIVNQSLADPIKQADLTNYIYDKFISKYDDIKPFSVVPTEYAGIAQDYLTKFGSNLNENIVVLWTGTSVCPDSITKEDIAAFNKALGREALIWWNYPVNDYWYDTPGRLFLGPVMGLDKNIDNTHGILSNPMSWESASQIALFGLADFTWNPLNYDHVASWEKSIEKLVPDQAEAMKLFAKNSSHLGTTASMKIRRNDSPYLNELFAKFNATYDAGDSIVEVANELIDEFTLMLDASKVLRTIDNKPLLEEIELWLNQFEYVAKSGIETMSMFIELENDDTAAVQKHIENANIEFAKMAENTRVTSIGAMPILHVLVGTQYVTPFITRQFDRVADQMYFANENITEMKIETNMPQYQSNAINLAIDKNMTTKFWSSKAQADGQFIKMTFDKVEELHTVSVYMAGADVVGKGMLQYSLDGETWIDLKDMSDRVAMGKYTVVVGEGEGVSAKYVRIMITGSVDKWLNVNEIIFTDNSEPILSDKTLLEEKINEAITHKEESYVSTTWPEFAEALENAQTAFADAEADQDLVDSALDALTEAMNKLVLKATFTMHLEIAVEEADKSTDEQIAKLVKVVADEFVAARKEAKDILNGADSSQIVVDESFERLANVMQYLSFEKGDKTQLKSLIERIEALDGDRYIASTWESLQEELLRAKLVMDDENALSAEVDETYTELLKSFLGLRLRVNKDALEDLINTVKSLDSKLYTKETWDALEQAMEDSLQLMNLEDATQEQVDEAVFNLQTALDNLVKIVQDPGDIVEPGDKPIIEDKPGISDKETLPKTGVSAESAYLVSIGLIALGYIFIRFRKRSQ